MKSLARTLRFGSPYCLSIAAGAMLLNVPERLCPDTLSLAVFTAASLVLVFLFGSQSRLSVRVRAVSDILSRLAVVPLAAFELTHFLRLLYAHIGNAVTTFRCAVAAALIALAGFAAANCGWDTLQKIANLCFPLPFLAIGIGFFGAFGGVDLSQMFPPNELSVLSSCVRGIAAALLLFFDVFLIAECQKEEHGFDAGAFRTACLFALGFVLLAASIHRMLFGAQTAARLAAPAASAASLVPKVDLEETYVFFYSVCILFRTSVKLCYVRISVKRLWQKEDERHFRQKQ